MKIVLAQARDGHAAGDVVDLDQGLAATLINDGLARPAPAVAAETVVPWDLTGLGEEQLLAFAAEHQLEVDHRFGVEKLTEQILAAQPTTTDS